MTKKYLTNNVNLIHIICYTIILILLPGRLSGDLNFLTSILSSNYTIMIFNNFVIILFLSRAFSYKRLINYILTRISIDKLYKISMTIYLYDILLFIIPYWILFYLNTASNLEYLGYYSLYCIIMIFEYGLLNCFTIDLIFKKKILLKISLIFIFNIIFNKYVLPLIFL